MTRFEEYTGINSGTINKIRDGISTTTLAKIAEACPELNIRWLLLGKGEMTQTTQTEPRATLTQPTVEIHSAQTVNIGNWSELIELIKSVKQ